MSIARHVFMVTIKLAEGVRGLHDGLPQAIIIICYGQNILELCTVQEVINYALGKARRLARIISGL